MYDDPRPEQEVVISDPPETVEAPSQPSGQSMWHGRTARDAQGRRIIWQEPTNGRGGRFVQLSEATASREAREAIQNERNRLTTLTRTAPMAEEYIRLGATTPTGSWGARSLDRERRAQASDSGNLWNGLNMPTQFEPNRASLERMMNLEDQALRGNIPPGGSSTANSGFEQQVLRGLFPTTTQLGSANLQNAATLFAERDLARRRVQEMENWLTEHQDLSDFEAHWATVNDSMRPALVQQYQRTLQQQANDARTAQDSPGTNAGAIAGRAGRRQQSNMAPRRGERRTYPNGAVAEWDGQGWAQVSPPRGR